MLFEPRPDEDFAQRRLQRLESRYRRAQNALAGARAVHASLCELPGVSDQKVQQAFDLVERAQRHLADLQNAIELAEDHDQVA
jgi:chromosome segregation ATPase